MKLTIFLHNKKVLSLAILIITQNMQTFSQDNLSNLFEITLPSILKIETYDASGNPLMSGTGFFISQDGKAISNLHVFKGAYKSTVTTAKGKLYKIKNVWFKSDSLDLVVFDIQNENEEFFPFLNISNIPPKIGEGVYVIGNPIGLDFTVSNGIISSIRTMKELGQIYQTNASISSGSSGSPLMKLDGSVIGVITFTVSEGQNLNFAISLLDKDLKNDLKSLDPSRTSDDQKINNPDWIEDIYSPVRAFHMVACLNWSFYIDFQKNMEGMMGFKWPINISRSNQYKPIESYVYGFLDGNIVGTSSVFVVDKNLAYVVSFGTDWSVEPTAKSSIILVSRITDGEPTIIFNHIVEKLRIRNTDNKFLEKVGNQKINMVIEDKIFVRSIYLEDHIAGSSFTGDTFLILPYEIKKH